MSTSSAEADRDTHGTVLVAMRANVANVVAKGWRRPAPVAAYLLGRNSRELLIGQSGEPRARLAALDFL